MPDRRRVYWDEGTIDALLWDDHEHHQEVSAAYVRHIDTGYEIWVTSDALQRWIGLVEGRLPTPTWAQLLRAVLDVFRVHWLDLATFEAAVVSVVDRDGPPGPFSTIITREVARRQRADVFLLPRETAQVSGP